MDTSKIDLTAPFLEDQLLEVRISKMKKMPGLDIMSGIDKSVCDRSWYVNKLGLEGDEHDPTFHGGIDKAVHGCKYSYFRP